MKKLLLIIAMLPLIAMMSCGDDNTPDINIYIDYQNTVGTDGYVYLVKGDTLTVDSLWVEAVNKKHIASIVGAVDYMFGGVPVARRVIPPYKLRLPTDSVNVGEYALQIVMDVAEEDCTLATAATQFGVKIVADSTEIPTGTDVAGAISSHYK